MNQDQVNQILRRVERAIENIHAYMGTHLDDSKGEAKRRHTRYSKKELVAKLSFKEHPFLKEDQLIDARVLDVSAGGMCVLLPARVRVKKKDSFSFAVLKNSGKDVVIRGEGKVVRLLDVGDEKEVGVKFRGGVQA